MDNKDLEYFLNNTKKEVSELITQIDEVQITKAAELIYNAQLQKNRVHITGIGKPSHVAEYIAALLSSTGTPTYFLDATEAVHGSAGQVVQGDVVIAISNSGQTAELRVTIEALQKLEVKLVGVSGNPSSWLAEHSDVFLFAGVNEEGDKFNKPPRASILAEIIVLQSLSIILQSKNELDMDKYYLWHPGGALGASIRNTKK